MKPPINIYPGSKIAFAAALSWSESFSKKNGVIQQEYSLNLNGTIYPSLYSAFVAQSSKLRAKQSKLSEKYVDDRFEILVELLVIKLTTYPLLCKAITLSGGINWLYTCCCLPSGDGEYERGEPNWHDWGLNSVYLTALIAAYRQVIKPDCDLANKQSTRLERHSKNQVYDPVSCQLKVQFQSFQKAQLWKTHLKDVLKVGAEYSLENSEMAGSKCELVVALVSEVEASAMSELVDFGLRPTQYNPEISEWNRRRNMPSALPENIQSTNL